MLMKYQRLIGRNDNQVGAKSTQKNAKELLILKKSVSYRIHFHLFNQSSFVAKLTCFCQLSFYLIPNLLFILFHFI